jgi:nucleoside-diphosphate-sugar epimerase
MKYLVTGGAGFIGSHLVERLLKENDTTEVVVIDNMYEGKLSNLPTDSRLTIYEGSILDPIEELFHEIDVVFHLAALTRPQESIADPEKYNETNITGVLRVLLLSKKHGVKRVVFVSSASAYGDQKILPTKETAKMNPMCPYALQKMMGEQYARLIQLLYGLEINYVRPFNVYGPRQNPLNPYSAAVPKFIDALIKGKTPYITGDGSQSRDFVYVTDCVEIMYLASKCKQSGEAFNAGSGKSTSISELYNVVCKVMDKDVTPDYVEKVIEPNTLADMSKVKRILNFVPQIDIKEGIRRTYEDTCTGK